MKKLSLFLVIFSVLNVNQIYACEDVSLSPKEFYTLAGRDKCYASYDGGCVCRVVDGVRTFPIAKCLEHPRNICECKAVFSCYDNVCTHMEVFNECPAAKAVGI